MPMLPFPRAGLVLAALFAFAAAAGALTLDHEKATHATLSSTVVTLTGHSELHLTGGGDPIPGCTIHLNSEDGWVFFHNVLPSATVSNLLPKFRVNGTQAVVDSNVRVVQHLRGSVVIPHPADYRPLRVFTGRHMGGASTGLATYTAYNNASLGVFADNIRSFILKRGYTATFARNENGTGGSRNFVAQDSDLEISVMPSALDGDVSFVRVFPWRWVSKKGSCDVSAGALNATWHYNWNISMNSPRDWEYVAIKQQPNWPSLNQDWRARGVNHLLGFNEPDNPVEDAYKNLTPQGSTADAVNRWPELLGTGLRVGAPAVTDGGYNWIADFMNRANNAGHRVDYVPVHYYRSYANNNDPQGAANQMYNFLKGIHDMARRPIWVTEFNNGANWTDNAHDPNTTQNRNVIQAMIQMMDNTPWIERYAIYSRVEWFRQTHYDDGGITPMGQMYRDHNAPMAYLQEVPNTGTSGNALYLFDGHLRDSLSGNNPLVYGTPKPVPGRHGDALSFDGTDDWLVLPGRLGDSSDFSFAAWVKWNGGPNWQRIFDLGNGTSSYLYLTPKSADTTLRFGLRVDGAQHQLNGPALTPGEWVHVAVTKNGTTGKLFVNGSVVATNSGITLTPSQVNTETNFLGKSQWSSDPLFSGLLDDVRFFNSGLSDAQVAALAASVAPQFVASPALPEARVDMAWSADLNTQIAQADGALTFAKVSGPAWLAVAADGSVMGVPTLADAGMAELRVSAAAPGGAMSLATIPVVVNAGDFAARYPFDGSVAAAVGKADGTPAGGATFGAGRNGQALVLDGVDDHVVLPPGVASADEFTFAAWVNWNGGGQWQRIFDFGNGTNSYLFLSPRSGGDTLRFAIKNGGSEQIVQAGQLQAGSWKHVAVTLGGGIGRLYVDGVLVATNAAMTLKPSDFRPAVNFLGRSQFPDPYFNGRIDDVHVFHRALDAAEIETLRASTPPEVSADPLVFAPAEPGKSWARYAGGNVPAEGATFTKVAGPTWLQVEPDGRISGTPGAADAGVAPVRVRALSGGSVVLARDFDVRVPVSPHPDLLAHFEFDGHVQNSVGTAHGTAFGGPGYAGGWFDRAIDLDGSDDHVQLPANVIPALTDATFATRFRWDGGGAWQRIFDFGNNTTQYFFLTPSSGSGTLRFAITLGGNATQQFIETEPAPIGEWTHVAVVLEGNTGTLYVNGAPATSGSITLDPAQVAPTLNYLGKSQWPDPAFNGALDDFRVIGRALTAAEVKALAVPVAGEVVPRPVGYAAWVEMLGSPAGLASADADADGDGLANVLEWLFGGDPLDSSDRPMPLAESLPAEVLGPDDGKTYLSFSARIRKDRPGVVLVPEAAATLDLLGTAEAAASVIQAGAPADEGEFEVFIWYYNVPLEDAPAGFMRLRVVVEGES